MNTRGETRSSDGTDSYAVNRAEFARMTLAREEDAVSALLAAVRTPPATRQGIATRAAAIMHAAYNSLFFAALFAQRGSLAGTW